MSTEALAAEQEIISRPELLNLLGLERTIRRLFCGRGGTSVTAVPARVMRFDFHFTSEGWRISEVNSDVPGGFAEASIFTRMMSEHYNSAQMSGTPIDEWTKAIASPLRNGRVVALLSAPGFMEDYQVIVYMARQLQALRCRPHLAAPQQIVWRDGRANLLSAGYNGSVDSIVRFYQGEWLARLPREHDWPRFFFGAITPVNNPGVALLLESKRFPLTWDKLKTQLPTWRALLPESRDPQDVDWAKDDAWLLKTAFCNNGDTVSARSEVTAKKWRAITRSVFWHPGKWLAQRRFETVPISTPLGPMHPCIGVYTFNGKAAGTYARVTTRQFIDYAAVDIALLLTDD